MAKKYIKGIVALEFTTGGKTYKVGEEYKTKDQASFDYLVASKRLKE